MPPTLTFGERTWLMGIVNVTADSFSGDGLAPTGRPIEEVVAVALERARGFVAAGAEILDVGAESTRPRGAYGDHLEVDPESETAAALPVVRALVDELGDRALISIDTSKGSVARAAVAAGATIVNDVWAARRDPGTADAAAAAGAHLVLMHNAEEIDYPNGVRRDRLVVDPGIGFGKGTVENLELLHRLAELKAALGGLPLLVGPSRKRFLGELLDGAPPDDRIEGTAATVAVAIAAGADIVRVHDVAELHRTRRVADAIVRR